MSFMNINGTSARGGSASGGKKVIQEEFDVLVIGGGAAGLMAAMRAAEKGARTALVEKNERYGIKVLMTGNGRCNVTQESDNMVELAKNYTNGRFLMSALNVFGPHQIREFLDDRGVETKVEKNGKVFPVSDQSKDVVEAFYQSLREQNITFFNEEEVVAIESINGKISKVVTKKKEIAAKNYVLATGGKSYPHTGSSGDGYVWAKQLGHSVIEPKPVLVPVRVEEHWIEKLQGVSVQNCAITVFAGGKKITRQEGDIMFAHFGLSGPLTLNLSREIEELIDERELRLAIDLKPYLSFQQLDEILRRDFEKNASKNFSNCLQDLFTPKLRDFLLEKSGIELEKHAAKISKMERQKLARMIKEFELTVESLFGFEKAMVTSGGVSTREIDSKTMKSKIVDNLYFAGEIIDVDGPTGGYNLQMCWSTGFVAGENAAE